MQRHYNTENEFINAEVTRLGWDEVERLLDIGFEPKLTNEGWRWIQVPLITVNPTKRRVRV
jgi:hypothetical protein